MKRAPWPTDFDTAPKVFIEGKTEFAKTKIEKVRDNTDRVLAVLEDTANTLDGILDEIERLVKRIEAKKTEHQWTQLKYNGFSAKVEDLETKYNGAINNMISEFSMFCSIMKGIGMWTMYSEVTKLKKKFCDISSTNWDESYSYFESVAIVHGARDRTNGENESTNAAGNIMVISDPMRSWDRASWENLEPRSRRFQPLGHMCQTPFRRD